MRTARSLLSALALLTLLSTINSQLSTCVAQGTAFTYQGRLQNSGAPASGLYDFRFKLYSDALGNNQVGSTVLVSGVPTTNGLFLATVDFGEGIFTGNNYWLEVDVRTNNTGGYTDLVPLQAVTPAPYAIFAGSASNLLGVIPAAGLSGTYGDPISLTNPANSFTGNGTGLTNANAGTLGGLTAGSFWQLGGNAVAGGQFLGSTNNQPVEVWVGGTRSLRFEPNAYGAPNVIGGAPINFVDPGIVGATIGGGGNVSGNFYLGGGSNHVGAIFGTIAGGRVNTILADHSFIGGGISNTVAFYAYDGVIGGGVANDIQYDANDSVLGGGWYNTIGTNDGDSVLSGGSNNSIQNNSYNSVIGGGDQNSIQTNSEYSVLGGGESNIITNAPYAFVGGGGTNSITAEYGSVGGGSLNSVAGVYGFVGGGRFNYAYGNYATVPGGNGNTAAGTDSFAAGTGAYAAYDGSFVWSDDSSVATFFSSAPNQFCVRATGGVSLTTSGTGMTLDGPLQSGNIVAGNIQSGNIVSGNIQSGDISMNAANETYHNLSLSGGNATGYLYGSYPALGDGIHLGYNYYYDNSGIGHVSHPGGGTSRISVGYGIIDFAVGGASSPPSTVMLQVSTGGVCANGTISNCSDRNAKQDLAPVDPAQILQRALELPVTKWSYKIDAGTRHIGPMAQDFFAAFAVGADEKHIATIDEGGVALAAIQGLNQKVEAGDQRSEAGIQKTESQIEELKTENAELQARLERLEKLIESKNEVLK